MLPMCLLSLAAFAPWASIPLYNHLQIALSLVIEANHNARSTSELEKQTQKYDFMA